jgi:hypothetical protein
MKTEKPLNNYAEILAFTTENRIRELDVASDIMNSSVVVIGSIAAIAAEYDAAIKDAKGDQKIIAGVRERFAKRLASVGAAAMSRAQERIDAMVRGMTPPVQSAILLAEYRKQMRDALDPVKVVGAYLRAAELHDDVTMQAVDAAPAWDEMFAVTADVRREARRIRWGEPAQEAEALEELLFHIGSVVAAVNRHIGGSTVVDPLDTRLVA